MIRVLIIAFSAFATCAAAEVDSLITIDQAKDRAGSAKTEIILHVEYEEFFESLGHVTGIAEFSVVGPNRLFSYDNLDDYLAPLTRPGFINEHIQIELREFYLDRDFSFGSLEGQVRIGKQQVVWGQADGLRLLDVVNPLDLSEFILEDYERSRIPLWMINMEWMFEHGQLQFLLIPDTSVNRVPEPGGAFAFTTLNKRIGDLAPITVSDSRHPSGIGHGDVGLRWSSYTGDWDLTLNYLYRYDDLPAYKVSMTSEDARLEFVYQRTQTFGASASTAFGDWVFRYEMVFNTNRYIETQNGSKSAGEIAYLAGFDWTGLTDTFVSLQMFQSYLVEEDTYLRDRTDNTITLLVRRNFWNETLRFESLVIYHLNDHDSLFRVSSTYQISSNLEFEFYGDRFNGSPSELYGQFDEQDRIGFRLAWSI